MLDQQKAKGMFHKIPVVRDSKLIICCTIKFVFISSDGLGSHGKHSCWPIQFVLYYLKLFHLILVLRKRGTARSIEGERYVPQDSVVQDCWLIIYCKIKFVFIWSDRVGSHGKHSSWRPHWAGLKRRPGKNNSCTTSQQPT